MVRTVVLVGVVVFAVACVLLAAVLTRANEAMRRRRYPDVVRAAGRPSDSRGRNPRGSAAEPAPAVPGALVAARAPGARKPRPSEPPTASPWREPVGRVRAEAEVRTGVQSPAPTAGPTPAIRRGLGNNGFRRFTPPGPNTRAIRSLDRA